MLIIKQLTKTLFLFLLCGNKLLGQLVGSSANSDLTRLGELFELMRQPPVTNVYLTAKFTDKRIPKYPLKQEDITNHVEKELTRLQSQGLVSEENIEESRRQITKSVVRFASNESKGSISEYFYRDKIRLDWTIFRGSNPYETTNAQPDRAITYVVLDKKLATDIPVLDVNILGKSILKKKVALLNNQPILINAIRPNHFCTIMVLSMLVDTNNISSGVLKRGESSLRMSHEMATRLLDGSHKSGVKLEIQNNKVDNKGDAEDTVYKFRKTGADSSVQPYILIKIRRFLKTKNDVLKSLTMNLGPSLFLEDIIEYDEDEIPSSFLHEEKSSESDSHKYQFNELVIQQLNPAGVENIFYETIPKDYFVEEEKNGQRRVVQNPYRLEPIGAKEVSGNGGTVSHSSKLPVRILTIFGMVLTSLALIYLVYKSQK
jgi:hypothetical protein